MVYQWKSGSRVKGDAQKSGELFEQLSKTKEGLTARTLLEANKPENAPLHNDYEWNDIKAAESWRLYQSNHFLNSIAVVVNTSTGSEDTAEQSTTVLVRGFHITTERSKYEPITTIVKEQSKYNKLLETAMSELKTFQCKYNALSELQPIFKAISEIERSNDLSTK